MRSFLKSPRKIPGDRVAVISVRDTGAGISPEMMQRLFSPFSTGREEGVGLGLFVTRKLVSQCGGRIGVKSVPGKGTTFTVEIPVGSESN